MNFQKTMFWGTIFTSVIVIVFWHFYRKETLAKKHVILTCKIVDIFSTNKSSPVFICETSYNGEIKRFGSVSSAPKKRVFIGKSFPFIYSSKINIGEVIITPEDFAKFNIPFPDSLQ